jgi:hypothetical protein
MTNPIERHVGQMLALAESRHAEAIAAIEARPLDIERARASEDLLGDAELLVQDCLDITRDVRLEVALDQLRDQRRMLGGALARFDALGTIPQQADPWASPLLWITTASLAILAVAAALAVMT